MAAEVENTVIGVVGLESPETVLKHIEKCGRIAYATGDRIADGTAEKFIQMIVRNGHESVLEHWTVTAFLQCDRATMAQLTRHRLASYTVESQRFCNYSLDKFGHSVTSIRPQEIAAGSGELQTIWQGAVQKCQEAYFGLLQSGCPAEVARSVLPNCTAVKMAMTANLREWRLIFKTRCDRHAQRPTRDLVADLLRIFKEKIPSVVSDLNFTD